MDVLMISDNNYAFLLAAALYSLFDANQEITEVRVFVIEDCISQENINKIEGIANQFKRQIIFLRTPKMPDGIVVKGNLNISTYYRLMMLHVIPEKLDKILYLDCDVLIRNSLEELWNTNIDNFFLAGVTDTTGRFARTSIGLTTNDKYVNAGVLLINLKEWREKNIENQFIDFLEQNDWKVEFNDQGVINKVCSKQIKLISPMYNYMPTYERYSRKELERIVQSEIVYDDNTLNEARNNPAIVHFAGYAFLRPWFIGSTGRYIRPFGKLLQTTGISFEYKKQPSGFKYRVRRMVNKMPNRICIVLNSFIDSVYVATEGIKRK